MSWHASHIGEQPKGGKIKYLRGSCAAVLRLTHGIGNSSIKTATSGRTTAV